MGAQWAAGGIYLGSSATRMTTTGQFCRPDVGSIVPQSVVPVNKMGFKFLFFYTGFETIRFSWDTRHLR